MKKINTDKCESQKDSDQTSFSSVVGWAKRNLLNLPDGGITPRRKTARMLLPVIAIFLVFVLVRVFNVSSPQSAVSEPISLIEQTTKDANSTDTDEQLKWQIPEMYPNKLTDFK